MLAIQRMEPECIFSPSTSPADWIPELGENCAVCGDRVNSTRLGSPACLGCIVFFRRSIIHSSKYRCLRDGNCLINYEFRSSCRFCRLQKCFRVGMKQSAVRRRDCLGPRRPSPSYSDPPVLYPETDLQLIDRLIKIQNRQFEEHKEQSVSCPRRASLSDINAMFKWSFNNAIEWASQFDPFQKLTNESQKCVLSEYGFAFFLIDQGFRTIHEKMNGCWMLQNGTFLHSDYHYGQNEDVVETDYKCLRMHFEFVKSLQIAIQKPFETLEIDFFEIAALKSLLLVSPSFPKTNIFSEYQERMTGLKDKCACELMEYLKINYPESHVERFGTLILILGEIRSAVKAVYNQTKVSELFNSSQFDPYVRSFFLS
ncbi:hypothetical protein GCK72_018671 [Caenorhabditis remanei]|uniref:Uncharacterized protein n=1 Tax=Caenorhabditis remanei TaxID=31234 RepID=A0A6A5GAE0_CAERE|nr:hypothetical protein GCK72_018671 [Caenorhabditis remanei]KAF1752117.1 hypothetical protein GCK72_018671 [Caenorhabditis remanei]